MGLFSYLFRPQPAPNAQDFSRRATLEQFQSFPANEIEGRGTLVSQNGVTGGKYWRITQPPQLYADHVAPLTDFLDGGTMAGGFYGAPLVPNPDSTSIG